MQVRTNYGDDLKRTGRRPGSAGKNSGTGTSSEAPKSAFLDILNEVLPAETADSAELNRLWSELPESEQKLLAQPSQENLQRYRELVRGILSATLRLNMSVQTTHRKGKNSGEKIELHYVRILDERLDRMAALIRSPRNAAFGLLKALEGVRGILLDLKR